MTTTDVNYCRAPLIPIALPHNLGSCPCTSCRVFVCATLNTRIRILPTRSIAYPEDLACPEDADTPDNASLHVPQVREQVAWLNMQHLTLLVGHRLEHALATGLASKKPKCRSQARLKQLSSTHRRLAEDWQKIVVLARSLPTFPHGAPLLRHITVASLLRTLRRRAHHRILQPPGTTSPPHPPNPMTDFHNRAEGEIRVPATRAPQSGPLRGGASQEQAQAFGEQSFLP